MHFIFTLLYTCKSKDTRNIANGSTHPYEYLKIDECFQMEQNSSVNYTKKMPSVRNINVPFLPLFTLLICERMACVAFKRPSTCSMSDLFARFWSVAHRDCHRRRSLFSFNVGWDESSVSDSAPRSEYNQLSQPPTWLPTLDGPPGIIS